MNKTYICITVAALFVSYAIGRYTTPVKVITNTVTIHDIDKKDTKTDEEKKTTTITAKKPDGSETTTTTVEDSTNTDTRDTNRSVETSSNTTVRTPSGSRPKYVLEVLASSSISDPGRFRYGLSASKQFIGPLYLGGFFLTDGTVGASIGLQF